MSERTQMDRAKAGIVVGVLVVVAVMIGVTVANQPTGTSDATGSTPTTAAAVTEPADRPTTAAPVVPGRPGPVSAVGDGVYKVGDEIVPGTYSAKAETRPCYWARLRSFGLPGSVIAEDNLEPGETQTVVVRSSDAGFKAANGCIWRRAGRAA
ncbi:hypothetical protein AB0K20_03150 [Micromonospora matsumotoense]|uniref:hypothetical protein n=1 Tax=Micromonospora matsumotoense TaxID=121616 RepID=UPI00343A2B64